MVPINMMNIISHKEQKIQTYVDASLRHINKYLCNNDIDDESNLLHLAHAISIL